MSFFGTGGGGPMSASLGKKLFFYTGGALVGVLLVTFVVLERNQSRQWEDHLRSQSLAFARFATPELLKFFRGSFAPGQNQRLAGVSEFLAFNSDLIQVFIYSPSGRRLYHSPPLGKFSGQALELDDSPALLARLANPEPDLQMSYLPDGGRAIDLLTPAVGPTGVQVLAVRYLISFESVEARQAEVRNYFLRIILIALLCSLPMVALVARRVTRPLSALTDGARSIATGELSTRIDIPNRDEIGALASAFNDMAVSLAANRDELTRKNEELVLANQNLQQMQEQLVRAERLATIGQLAAGVSHEIDNPVGIILGYAELLLDDLGPDDPCREDVQAIIAECRRCKRITGGLLGLARSSAASKESFGLNGLIEETLASLRPHKLFKEIHFCFRPLAAAPLVVADRDQIRQVLVNLILNAAQAMGGRGELELDGQVLDASVVVRVIDSGPGIPDKLKERIFEPFFSTKGAAEGTGLGLAVCRKLVEDHGGRIWTESSLDGGAVFLVSLPLEESEKCFDNRHDNSLG